MHKCPTCDHVFECGSPPPLAVCEHCVAELKRSRGVTGMSLEEEWRRAGIPEKRYISSRTYILTILSCLFMLAGFIWRVETLQREQAACTCAERVQR